MPKVEVPREKKKEMKALRFALNESQSILLSRDQVLAVALSGIAADDGIRSEIKRFLEEN